MIYPCQIGLHIGPIPIINFHNWKYSYSVVDPDKLFFMSKTNVDYERGKLFHPKGFGKKKNAKIIEIPNGFYSVYKKYVDKNNYTTYVKVRICKWCHKKQYLQNPLVTNADTIESIGRWKNSEDKREISLDKILK